MSGLVNFLDQKDSKTIGQPLRVCYLCRFPIRLFPKYERSYRGISLPPRLDHLKNFGRFL
jgi:hypothetical protein